MNISIKVAFLTHLVVGWVTLVHLEIQGAILKSADSSGAFFLYFSLF
jgi:hypothetical protein